MTTQNVNRLKQAIINDQSTDADEPMYWDFKVSGKKTNYMLLREEHHTDDDIRDSKAYLRRVMKGLIGSITVVNLD